MFFRKIKLACTDVLFIKINYIRCIQVNIELSFSHDIDEFSGKENISGDKDEIMWTFCWSRSALNVQRYRCTKSRSKSHQINAQCTGRNILNLYAFFSIILCVCVSIRNVQTTTNTILYFSKTCVIHHFEFRKVL